PLASSCRHGTLQANGFAFSRGRSQLHQRPTGERWLARLRSRESNCRHHLRSGTTLPGLNQGNSWKIVDDEIGSLILYTLNPSNVQTFCVAFVSLWQRK